MDRIKTLARRHLPDSVIRAMRRIFHAWQDRRDRTAGLSYTTKDLRHASRQLWAGHSRTAADLLSHVAANLNAPATHRARASFNLAKLHATNNDWQAATTWLDDECLRNLDHADKARGHILKAMGAMQSGSIDEAQACIDDESISSIGRNQRWPMRANLEYYHALLNGPDTETRMDERRLGHINQMYRDAGLSEICKRDPDTPLTLGNIVAKEAAPGARATDVKVSVLVPCFNAEDTIHFALDSILEQTHENVEIVCVDDRSSDGTQAIIESYIDSGAPVSLLVNERNSGPYHGRNRALEAATGEFVTVQDADDWTHPQRIEMQLAYLQANRGVKFSFTRLARVADNFLFTLRPFRPMLEPIHWSYTSIMGRRQLFLDLGGWDPVVAHADAEFIDRVKDQIGERALGECYDQVPMALFTDGDTNLTKRAGTGLTTVGFGARREYQEQARRWRSNGSPGLPSGSALRRESGYDPFFVPNALLPKHLQREAQYDLVFVTDMSLLGGTRRCNLEYFRICVERGWKVGVFNYPRYQGRLAGSIDGEYRQLFDRGEVDLLTPEDSVESRLLIIHHPPILAAPIDRYPSIRTRYIGLLVNQLPYQSTRSDADLLYDPTKVEMELEREFGIRPFWIPISGLVRSRLEEFVGNDRILNDTWYPVVHSVRRSGVGQETERNHPGRAIRVGRHSRDDETKWPDSRKELRWVYPNKRDMEIRILGGADTVCGGQIRLPSNWIVHPFDSVEVGDFLDGIDVFIHWTRSDYIEEFGRNVAEAMACGVPCILSRDLEPTFGDAALYPAAEKVAETIRKIAKDNDLRRDLVQKGQNFVRENCSAEVAGDRMNRLLTQEPQMGNG